MRFTAAAPLFFRAGRMEIRSFADFCLTMFAFFHQPYPAPESGLSGWRAAGAAGVFIFLFLFVFQPFELYTLPWADRLEATLGYGAVTTFVLLIFYDVLPRLVPAWFDPARWTVGRHIIFLSLAIAVIAFGNLLWSRWLQFFPLTAAMLLYMTAITFLIGLFPAFAFTALTYIRFVRRYGTPATVVATPNVPATHAAANVVLIAENEKDRLELPVEALLYLESADNYTQVVYRRHDGVVTRTLLRGSLTRFEQQLALPDVRRCHRSYIVNLRQVERISGNAQGYKLHLVGVETPVPVARRYAGEVVK
jgi:DNA-binding LytR/AlgR family response regulator